MDWEGQKYQSSPFGAEMSSDLGNFPHDHIAGTIQASDQNGGFIKAVQTYDKVTGADNTSDLRKRQVLGYFPYQSLPILHTLGDHFVLCTRWFSSIKGPTWPNRNFAISGTTEKVTMPDDTDYDQTQEGAEKLSKTFIEAERLADYKLTSRTVFHRCMEKDVPFKIYFHDIPSTLLHRDCWSSHLLTRHVTFDHFYRDAAGPADSFPAVAWLEPAYGGPNQNDGHPPAGMEPTEHLIGSVYNALRANTPLWESTLLIVVFDEHGGLFDPVVPPAAPAPGPEPVYKQPIYNSLGFRVPCLLVSPWLPAAADNTTFDHTSWLRFAQRRFGLGPLGDRAAAANDFNALFLPAVRRDCPPPFQQLPPATSAAAAAAAGHGPGKAAAAMSEFQGEMRSMLVDVAAAGLHAAGYGGAVAEAAAAAWAEVAGMVHASAAAGAPRPPPGKGQKTSPRPSCCGLCG